ncbi:hypothetical protein [Thermosporothrix hazakensis]|nr:hypothetical protein [Thermosporothrix hazakensis]
MTIVNLFAAVCALGLASYLWRKGAPQSNVGFLGASIGFFVAGAISPWLTGGIFAIPGLVIGAILFVLAIITAWRTLSRQNARGRR